MVNQYVNKVIYGSDILIDLTGDTIAAEDLAQGKTAHDKSGAPITGTNTKDSDTQDATAAEAEILVNKTAYARGVKLTGTMPDNGSKTLTITEKDDEIAIPLGFHDGSGKAVIDATEKAKLITNNIRQGVTILGVEGGLEPSSEVTSQSKAVTPAITQQVVLPDEGYDYLSQVTVAAIPYTESDNAAGGKTVTIAGAA